MLRKYYTALCIVGLTRSPYLALGKTQLCNNRQSGNNFAKLKSRWIIFHLTKRGVHLESWKKKSQPSAQPNLQACLPSIRPSVTNTNIIYIIDEKNESHGHTHVSQRRRIFQPERRLHPACTRQHPRESETRGTLCIETFLGKSEPRADTQRGHGSAPRGDSARVVGSSPRPYISRRGSLRRFLSLRNLQQRQQQPHGAGSRRGGSARARAACTYTYTCILAVTYAPLPGAASITREMRIRSASGGKGERGRRGGAIDRAGAALTLMMSSISGTSPLLVPFSWPSSAIPLARRWLSDVYTRAAREQPHRCCAAGLKALVAAAADPRVVTVVCICGKTRGCFRGKGPARCSGRARLTQTRRTVRLLTGHWRTQALSRARLVAEEQSQAEGERERAAFCPPPLRGNFSARARFCASVAPRAFVAPACMCACVCGNA